MTAAWNQSRQPVIAEFATGISPGQSIAYLMSVAGFKNDFEINV
jgi:hypothetical protein